MRQPRVGNRRASAPRVGTLPLYVALLAAPIAAAFTGAAQAQSAQSEQPGDPTEPMQLALSPAERAVQAHRALLGLDASPPPRFTRTELPVTGLQAGAGSTVASSGIAGPALQPASVRMSDVSYRWWISRGRVDWGVGFGATAVTAQPLGAAPGAPPITLGSSPSLTVGMRYRTSPHSTVFADASSTPGLGLHSGDAYIGKVGVEWKPASLASRWNVSYGGIGWRLNSDSRMTLRVRSGGVGLYMRSRF